MTSFGAVFSQTAKSKEQQVRIAKLPCASTFLRSLTACDTRGRHLKQVLALHPGARTPARGQELENDLWRFRTFFDAGGLQRGHFQRAGGQDSDKKICQEPMKSLHACSRQGTSTRAILHGQPRQLRAAQTTLGHCPGKVMVCKSLTWVFLDQRPGSPGSLGIHLPGQKPS
jgi:hypothetical protein